MKPTDNQEEEIIAAWNDRGHFRNPIPEWARDLYLRPYHLALEYRNGYIQAMLDAGIWKEEE